MTCNAVYRLAPCTQVLTANRVYNITIMDAFSSVQSVLLNTAPTSLGVTRYEKVHNFSAGRITNMFKIPQYNKAYCGSYEGHP